MLIICPSDSGVETFDPLLSPTTHEIRPWWKPKKKAQPSAKTAEINMQTTGSCSWHASVCFAWQQDCVWTPGTARRLLASAQHPAVKLPHKFSEKSRGCPIAEKSGGGVFTSAPLLLPCTVGNQLLRTGETPFVAVCLFRAATLRSAQQRPLLHKGWELRPFLSVRLNFTVRERSPKYCSWGHTI